ncbi:MAG: hypothetical protein P8Y70_21210 [Candidatus Lokiarchaeota archaeon]
MTNKSKVELYKEIQSEYHRKLRDLEKEVSRTNDRSHLSELKAEKVNLTMDINKLKKKIKRVNKDRNKKIKKIKKS